MNKCFEYWTVGVGVGVAETGVSSVVLNKNIDKTIMRIPKTLTNTVIRIGLTIYSTTKLSFIQQMEGQPPDEKKEKEIKLAKIKYQIEQRYQRLNTAKRRPSTEYIPSEEILELFLPFAANPTEFQTLSEEELQEFYTKWYVNMYSKSTDSLDISSATEASNMRP